MSIRRGWSGEAATKAAEIGLELFEKALAAAAMERRGFEVGVVRVGGFSILAPAVVSDRARRERPECMDFRFPF